MENCDDGPAVLRKRFPSRTKRTRQRGEMRSVSPRMTASRDMTKAALLVREGNGHRGSRWSTEGGLTPPSNRQYSSCSTHRKSNIRPAKKDWKLLWSSIAVPGSFVILPKTWQRTIQGHLMANGSLSSLKIPNLQGRAWQKVSRARRQRRISPIRNCDRYKRLSTLSR